jgi:hypothetical protein
MGRDAVEQLKRLWMKLTSRERQTFLRWQVEQIEDQIDIKAARAALKEKGRRIPWAELKKKLG